MKLKYIVGLCSMAFSISAAALQTPIVQETFAPNETKLINFGPISLSSTSDVSGSFFSAQSINFGFFTLTLSPITFGGATYSGTNTGISPNFSFANVAMGTYDLKASATSSNGGLAFMGANYTVTAVPEPETLAMMLAGLGAIGFMIRRRNAG
ncbi:FxDxF family PEP-CTERM protein [Piscinibacter sakaiensis]|uniref:FxDxF family PEP-CTERM protein n=1 Tax=Piscinibacter sakaiensis TaxID=1547922 RepID=UPI003AACD041